MPLPDAPSLRTLLRIHLGNAEHSLGESALNELSKQMGGLSGADVSVLVRDALLEPVRDLQRATHFRKAADGRWEACAPNVRGATKMGLMQVRQPSPTHTRGLPPSTPALLPLSSPTFPLPTPTSPLPPPAPPYPPPTPLLQVPTNALRKPVATAAHFAKALKAVRPSIGRETLARYEEWTREFGSGQP